MTSIDNDEFRSNRMTVANDRKTSKTETIEVRIDQDPVGISASELAGNPSLPSLNFAQTYPNQPQPCDRCAGYRDNAERAYKVVEAFSRKRQETITLQKQVKDLYAVLDDRQGFVLDLQRKLEQEKAKNIELDNKLTEQRIELECTKEELEFVRGEAEKNKQLVEKTGEHDKKLNDMQKLLDRTTADHAVIQNKMFCLAKIVAGYQKKYGAVNTLNVNPTINSNVLLNELDSDDLESNTSVIDKTPLKRGVTESQLFNELEVSSVASDEEAPSVRNLDSSPEKIENQRETSSPISRRLRKRHSPKPNTNESFNMPSLQNNFPSSNTPMQTRSIKRTKTVQVKKMEKSKEITGSMLFDQLDDSSADESSKMTSNDSPEKDRVSREDSPPLVERLRTRRTSSSSTLTNKTENDVQLQNSSKRVAHAHVPKTIVKPANTSDKSKKATISTVKPATNDKVKKVVSETANPEVSKVTTSANITSANPEISKVKTSTDITNVKPSYTNKAKESITSIVNPETNQAKQTTASTDITMELLFGELDDESPDAEEAPSTSNFDSNLVIGNPIKSPIQENSLSIENPNKSQIPENSSNDPDINLMLSDESDSSLENSPFKKPLPKRQEVKKVMPKEVLFTKKAVESSSINESAPSTSTIENPSKSTIPNDYLDTHLMMSDESDSSPENSPLKKPLPKDKVMPKRTLFTNDSTNAVESSSINEPAPSTSTIENVNKPPIQDDYLDSDINLMIDDESGSSPKKSPVKKPLPKRQEIKKVMPKRVLFTKKSSESVPISESFPLTNNLHIEKSNKSPIPDDDINLMINDESGSSPKISPLKEPLPKRQKLSTNDSNKSTRLPGPSNLTIQIEEPSLAIDDEMPSTSNLDSNEKAKIESKPKREDPINEKLRKRRGTISTTVPVAKRKIEAVNPPSPKRALLIDVPFQNPQAKRTRAQTSKAMTKPMPTQINHPKNVTPFNFISTTLKDIVTNKLSMTDGVKRFNAELKRDQNATKQPLSTEQLLDVLIKFIRSEQVGDLWFTLKKNSTISASSSKDALISTTERLFFQFIDQINSDDGLSEKVRWPGIFSSIVGKMCLEYLKSSNLSLVQKCRDFRVMTCSFYFSEKHEAINEPERNKCINNLLGVFDQLLQQNDSANIVKILCFVYTTNGNFLFNNLFNLDVAPIFRLRLLRLHIKNSAEPTQTFFKLIRDDAPANLLELLEEPVNEIQEWLDEEFGIIKSIRSPARVMGTKVVPVPEINKAVKHCSAYLQISNAFNRNQWFLDQLRTLGTVLGRTVQSTDGKESILADVNIDEAIVLILFLGRILKAIGAESREFAESVVESIKREFNQIQFRLNKAPKLEWKTKLMPILSDSISILPTS